MGGDGNEAQELNIRTVQGAGEGGRDSISIELPALTHALERIVVNGKELDMRGLCGVRIGIGTGKPHPEMTLETAQGEGEDRRDSLSIELPSRIHAIERIVVNGKELDMRGLCGVRIGMGTGKPLPEMTLQYIPECFRR